MSIQNEAQRLYKQLNDDIVMYEVVLREKGNAQTELESLNEDTTRKKLLIEKEVNEAEDENGKKRFSNDTLRRAEADRRLNSDSDYLDVYNRLKDKENHIRSYTARIESIKERLRTTRTQMEFLKTLIESNNEKLLFGE